MARILKRPMFNRGGSTNNGIMTGLVDRKGYADGPTQAEIYAKEYEDMLSKIDPPRAKLPLGQIGLNLISGQYAGDGLLQNIAGSAKDPYASFVKQDDALRNLGYQKRMTAAKMGISRAEAERLAKLKNQKKTGYAAQTPEEQFKVRLAAYQDSRIPAVKNNATNLAAFEVRHAGKPYFQIGFVYSNKTKQFEPDFRTVPPGGITFNPVDSTAYKNDNGKLIRIDPISLLPIENVDGTE